MTLKQIKAIDDILHDRSCVILVNFNAKELNLIKTVGNFAGIKDRIVLTSKNGNTKIKDILDENILEDNEDIWQDKAIIFNNIQNNKVSGFLDGLKKVKLKRPLTAIVTETSIKWTLTELIFNLKEERAAIAKGKTAKHDK